MFDPLLGRLRSSDTKLVVQQRGGGGGDSPVAGVTAVIAGTNISVDNTNPQQPIVSSTASGLAIGDPVSGGTNERMLYVDDSGNLADSLWNVTLEDVAGGFLQVSAIAPQDVTGIHFSGVDATGLGGAMTLAVLMGAGTASSFAIANQGTLANYFNVTKDASEVANLQLSGTTITLNDETGGAVLDTTNAGIRLDGANARINEFSTDGTLAGNSDTAVPTEKATKTYVDTEIAAIPPSGTGNLGKTTDGASSTSSGSSRKRVSVHTMTEDGGSLKAFIRCNVSASTQKLKALIYSDLAGEPDALLAVSDEITVSNTTVQRLELPFSYGNRALMLNGEDYWIGYINEANSNSFIIYRDSTATSNKQNADTYSDGATDPFGSNSTETGVIDVYIEYGSVGNAIQLGGLDTYVQYNDNGVFSGSPEFVRNADNVTIGDNVFHDSTSATPNLLDLAGRMTSFSVSSYTGGSQEANFESIVQIPDSASSGYIGLYGRAQTGGGATNASVMTGLNGEVYTQHSSGTIANVRAGAFGIANNSTGAVTSGVGFEIAAATNGGGGTIGTLYGLIIGSQTVGGTNYSLRAYDGATVFNENGAASGDFRIEGDTNANLFFVDYSADKVGIGTNAPTSTLTINGDLEVSGDIVGQWANTRGAGTAVADTVTETSLLSSTVALPDLATGEAVEFTAVIEYINNSGANRNPTWRFKIGSTTILTLNQGNASASATSRFTTITGVIYAIGANSERLSAAGFWQAANGGFSIISMSGSGTGAEAIQNAGLAFDISVQHPAATTLQSAQLLSLTMKKVKP